MKDVELLYTIEDALYELARVVEQTTEDYLGSEPNAENRAEKLVKQQDKINETKHEIQQAILKFIKINQITENT